MEVSHINSANNDTILKLSHIDKRFPGVHALKDISLEVRRGEVHALIGENGAGKSTLIKIITGAYTPDSGTIEYDGKEYARMTPQESVRVGIGAIYQEFTLSMPLSVAENIYMGQRVNDGVFRDYKLMCQKASEIIGTLGVSIDPKALVRELSVAYRQLVEICKALARKAKFLIMDEPTAPLTDEEVRLLFRIIADLKAQGITIIYISHRLDELFAVADRLTVMRDGEIVTTQDIKDVTKPQLIAWMVGRTLKESFPERTVQYGDIVLEARELSGNGVGPISFQLHAGEVLGLGGLVGAGRTEIARVIFGADKKTGGNLLMNGKEVHFRTPMDAIKSGIGLVSEDRKNQGVLQRMAIDFNISLPIIKEISKALFVDKGKENSIVNQQVENLQIKTPSVKQLVANLSGGNQQKVVLAKWLASDSKVLILDEPTRGIDVGAKQEIYRLINALAEQGKAIILITSEMEELLGLTDRMLVLYEHKYVGSIERENYSQELVLQYASGETEM